LARQTAFANLSHPYRTNISGTIAQLDLPRPEDPELLEYLITDPKALGIVAWASTAITVSGFAVAIWQILKVKRAADAARDAALGLAQRVRSRELLAKLGDAHTHLEAARNHVGRGERELAIVWLELSSGCTIEAREISRRLGGGQGDLYILAFALGDLAEQLTAMPAPITADPGFIELQLQLRRESERLQRILAESRYRYDVGEE
jgi:hypothetical protein